MGIIFGRPWYPFMPVVYTHPHYIVERPIIVSSPLSPLPSPLSSPNIGMTNMGMPNMGMPSPGAANMGGPNGGKRTKKLSRRKRRLNSRKN